jgi:hypothetical protein
MNTVKKVLSSKLTSLLDSRSVVPDFKISFEEGDLDPNAPSTLLLGVFSHDVLMKRLEEHGILQVRTAGKIVCICIFLCFDIRSPHCVEKQQYN